MDEPDWLKKEIIRTQEVFRRYKSKEYAKVVLNRKVKSGKIIRVMNGVYTTIKDGIVVASNLYYPSYVSLLYASAKYGFSEQIPRRIQVITKKSHRSIEFEGQEIVFIKSNEVWGYHKEADGSLMVDIEKLMIDVFLYPKEMGNLREIENVFENTPTVDQIKLLDYLKRLQSEKIARQVGYLLEKHLGIDISRKIKIGHNYYNLDFFHRSKKISKKWRLYI